MATASKTDFQQIQTLYLALLVGQITFAGVVVWLLFSGGLNIAMEENLFAIVTPAVTAITIFVAYYVQNRRQAAAAFLPDVSTKVNHYRQSILISSALLEAGNLLAIVAAMLTGSTYYLLYFAIGLAAFLLMRPSMDIFSQMYQLTREEVKTLESKGELQNKR